MNDIIYHNAIFHAAMLSLENYIWRCQLTAVYHLTCFGAYSYMDDNTGSKVYATLKLGKDCWGTPASCGIVWI